MRVGSPGRGKAVHRERLDEEPPITHVAADIEQAQALVAREARLREHAVRHRRVRRKTAVARDPVNELCVLAQLNVGQRRLGGVYAFCDRV